MPRYLLDKNISRRTIEALYHLDRLSGEERLVLRLWRQLQARDVELFIPAGTVNVLKRFSHLLEVRAFLATVEPLTPGKYLKRWARRLREHGFTGEDAVILALATFGTTISGDILGTEGIITLDQPFINNFQTQHPKIEKRFRAMTIQLNQPYRQALLPIMWHPGQLIKKP